MKVTLYSRPGCHLCDEARAEIEARRGELPAFVLEEVDINRDDALLRAFLERIPVVEVDGEVISELILDAEALRSALDRRAA